METRISARISEEVIKEAREWTAASTRYENLSHYIRCALVRQNKLHKEETISLNQVSNITNENYR